MFKTDKYMAIAGLCMLTLSACTADDVLSVPDTELQGKTPIELTSDVSGQASMTRTGFTGSGNTLLMLRMKSEKVFSYDVTSRTTDLYMTTSATAAVDDDNNAATHSAVTFSDEQKRFWDDVHGRNAGLSIFAIAVPNVESFSNTSITNKAYFNQTGKTDDSYSPAWNTLSGGSTVSTWSNKVFTNAPSDNYTVAWTTSAIQNASTIKEEDLCYSNNISNPSGGSGSTDGRMKFNTIPKKFDSGELEFHHAMTRISVKLIRGTGYYTASDFTLESLKVMANNTGQIDVATGTASNQSGADTGVEIKDTKTASLITANCDSTSCLVYPGLDMYLTDANKAKTFLDVTIANNHYKVSRGQVAESIRAVPGYSGFTALQPGVHYVLTLTIGKTKVDAVSASLADWTTIDISHVPSNARVTVLFDTAATNSQPFDLYRAADVAATIPTNDDFSAYKNWTTGYVIEDGVAKSNGGKATLTEPDANGVYKTDWVWNNNRTGYHFRTITPQGTPVNDASESGVGYDYVTLAHAAIANGNGKASGETGGGGNDILWGAPFFGTSTNYKPTYTSAAGFAADPHFGYAIGPKSDGIMIIENHVMTDVYVELEKTTGENAVTLTGATVEFLNFLPSGYLAMGSGKISANGTAVVAQAITSLGSAKYSWRMVPQSTSGVRIRITAEDNEYYVTINDLDDPTSTTTPKAKFTEWLPGKKYTYTFTLRKTDVLVSATMADWEEVSAGNDNVQIR